MNDDFIPMSLPMSQISHRLFVSDYAEAVALISKNPHKITAVLNVAQVPHEYVNPSIVYMHLSFADGEEIPPFHFVKCLGWLKFMYEWGHTILIHCAEGVSRSVTICASFMHYMKMAEFNDALTQIKQIRPIANPAPETLSSAKRMLGVSPYDGSAGSCLYEKMIEEAFQGMDAARAASLHRRTDFSK